VTILRPPLDKLVGSVDDKLLWCRFVQTTDKLRKYLSEFI